MLRAADLFLLTTEPPESFGIVLIEAMACGLPVIATDYPGVRAVVDDGETGLLVAARRPAARSPRRSASWSAAPSGARAMGERGRREGGRRVELAAAGRAHGRRLRGGDRGAAARSCADG